MTPLVSILMSVFNGRLYLRESIDSILNQTFQDIELVIVNDGSTDTTAKIIESYSDARVIRVVNEVNIGLPASLNKGLAVCRGMYVARQDADDVSMPDRIEKQVRRFTDEPTLDILGTQMNVVDEVGNHLYHYDMPKTHSGVVWRLLFGRALAHPSVMFKRDFIQKLGGYDPHFRFTEDIDLWTRAAENHAVFANLDEPLCLYRDRKDSISHQKHKDQAESAAMIRRRFSSGILGRQVSLESAELLGRISLEKLGKAEDLRSALPLVINLRSAMIAKGFLKEHELQEVDDDIADRFIMKPEQVACIEKPKRKGLFAKIKQAALNPRRAFHVIRDNAAGIFDEFKHSAKGPIRDTTSRNNNGITIIILSYERPDSLALLLNSLINQDLGRLGIELMICNNSSSKIIADGKTGIGSYPDIADILKAFNEPKVFNLNYNWKCRVRYGIGTLASYPIILFLDDDLILNDVRFVGYMYEAFTSLEKWDILSCWNEFWTQWDDKGFESVSLNFNTPGINEITPCDTVGPGICMFRKAILHSERIAEMSQGYERADDMAFPLIANLVFGSKAYYLPSYRMVSMHDDHKKAPLHTKKGHFSVLYGQYKSLLEEGYRPVQTRIDELEPIQRAAVMHASNLPAVFHKWTG